MMANSFEQVIYFFSPDRPIKVQQTVELIPCRLTSLEVSDHAVAWKAWQTSLRSQEEAIFHPLHGPRGPEHLAPQHSCCSHSHSEVPGLSPEGLLSLRACRAINKMGGRE